jgi:hypothetical protein
MSETRANTSSYLPRSEKLVELLNATVAKNIVRFISLCYFAYIFYKIKYLYPQIPLNFSFAVRCAILSGIASGGLFLSTSCFFRDHGFLGFFLLLPIFPSILIVTPGIALIALIFVIVLIYSYFVFFVKRKDEVAHACYFRSKKRC